MSLRGEVRGIIAARKAFQALPQVMRDQFNEATEDTAIALAADARQRVPVDTGTLRDHIGHSFSKRSGFAKVGIRPGRVAIAGAGGSALTSSGARLLEPRKYARMVEFGTVKQTAQPFMLPAAEGQRVHYARRLRDAGKRGERQLASSRFL